MSNSQTINIAGYTQAMALIRDLREKNIECGEGVAGVVWVIVPNGMEECVDDICLTYKAVRSAERISPLPLVIS